ncbi:MAG: hypothetical protein IJV33_07055 [Bacteroidaceae bacterium]|nr:hypothetical protein [Bacteroidaceae bacterium]
MIEYFNGDTASYQTVLSEWCNFHRAIFSSKRKWLLKATPAAFLLSYPCSFLLYFSLNIVRDEERAGFHFLISAIVFFLAFLILMLISYYHSFIEAKKFTHTMEDFLTHHLPHATITARTTPNHYSFEWKGEPFDIIYDIHRKSNKWGLWGRREMLIAMWYVVEENGTIFDNEGEIKKDFIEDLQAFGADKPACRGIAIDNQRLQLCLDVKETQKSNRNVEESLDMLLYLAQRFHLTPMPRWTEPLQRRLLKEWMDKMLEEKLPETMKSFSFLMYEGKENSYFVEFRGTSTFEQDNYDWIGRDVVMTGKRPFKFTEIQAGEEVMQKFMWEAVLYLAWKYSKGELSQIEGIGIDYYDKNLGLTYSKEEIVAATK